MASQSVERISDGQNAKMTFFYFSKEQTMKMDGDMFSDVPGAWQPRLRRLWQDSSWSRVESWRGGDDLQDLKSQSINHTFLFSLQIGKITLSSQHVFVARLHFRRCFSHTTDVLSIHHLTLRQKKCTHRLLFLPPLSINSISEITAPREKNSRAPKPGKRHRPRFSRTTINPPSPRALD